MAAKHANPSGGPSPQSVIALSEQPSRRLAWWFLAGYLLLIGAGLGALRMPGAMVEGNELNFDRAVFTSVNSATLTGLQLNVGQGQFSPNSRIAPATILLLTLGGSVFSMSVGGVAVVRIVRLPYTSGQVISAAVTATALSTLVGTAALYNGGRTLLDALLQSASAFGNSGVFSGKLGGPDAWETHLVLLPLAVLGGLGLPVLMELYDRIALRRPLSEYARTILVLSAGIYVLGFAILLASRGSFWSDLFAGAGQMGWYHRQSVSIRAAVASSSELAINSRTVGFPFEFAHSLPRTTQWVLVALMIVGANSAGTGGGVKATTFVQLARGVADALAGRRVSRAFGIASVWLGGYLCIVLFGFLSLLWQAPELPPDRLLFLSVSAASNVGLAHDSISMVLGGLFTLSAVMLLGRLAPLLILWWLAETVQDVELPVG